MHSLTKDFAPSGPGRAKAFTQDVYPTSSTPEMVPRSPSQDILHQISQSSEDSGVPLLPQSPHPMRSRDELDPKATDALLQLIVLVKKHKSSEPQLVPLDQIFQLYDQLPDARVCYIPRRTIRHLFAILSRQIKALNWVTQRYIQILNDLLQNNSTIRRLEWSLAIDAIGKGFNYPKQSRLHVALQTVLDMESAGVQADVVLFTILLQMAVREGDSNVVDMIEDILKQRKLADDVVLWTARVTHAGKQKNVLKIHELFKEFSDSGIPVDIILVNAFMQAFLSAGHPNAAEFLYLKLRTFGKACLVELPSPQVEKSPLAIRQERKNNLPRRLHLREQAIERELKRRRIDAADLINEDGSPSEVYNEILDIVTKGFYPSSATLIPNRQSIRLFVTYHCHYSGKLDDVVFYLNEMDVFGIKPNYGTFVDILHGFFKWHTPSSQWTADRLENVFSFLRRGIEEWSPPFPINYAVALASIRAHGKVYGGKKAREVWELLRPWLVINENTERLKAAKVGNLEQLVVAFEKGRELSAAMAGQDLRWRIIDWRSATV